MHTHTHALSRTILSHIHPTFSHYSVHSFHAPPFDIHFLHTPILHHLFSLSCLSHPVFTFLLLLIGRSWHVGLSGPLITLKPRPAIPEACFGSNAWFCDLLGFMTEGNRKALTRNSLLQSNWFWLFPCSFFRSKALTFACLARFVFHAVGSSDVVEVMRKYKRAAVLHFFPCWVESRSLLRCFNRSPSLSRKRLPMIGTVLSQPGTCLMRFPRWFGLPSSKMLWWRRLIWGCNISHIIVLCRC